TAGELMADLKDLKKKLVLKKAERSGRAIKRTKTDENARSSATGFGWVGRRKKALVVTLVGLCLVAAALAILRLPASALQPIDSVAVLPFADPVADPNTEYLSDGITESIINSLAQLPQLRVMARSTVFTYKGREVDPRKVGTDLKVRTVLMGRVIKRGETV